MRTAAHIIETVGKLVKKYDTRDPYELCKCLEIKIHFYNLEKKLKGFFFYQSRQKNIVIDSNVNDVLEELVSPMYIRKTKFLKDDLGDYDDANHFEYE